MAASQLKVKAGACRRIQKELQMYVQEEREARGKVEKLTADGGDSHDIKYADNILQESVAMIPDTRQRLEAALKDLAAYLDETDASQVDAAEATAAREEIAKGRALLA